MRGRLIFATIAITAAGALLYWGLFDRVSVFFTVQPGGGDVVVRVNGRRIQATTVSPESNSYSFSLRHGKYLVTVEKPRYIRQQQTLHVRWGDGDEYPVFLPLQRANHSP